MENTHLPSHESLLTTPLLDVHQSLDAKMVDFVGFLMPLQYVGIVAEHHHTRSHCSLFDVSHMGQAWILGENYTHVAQSLQSVVPANLLDLPEGKMCYTTLLNEHGGIVDDVIISRLPNQVEDFMVNGKQAYFHIVVNAARKEIDYAYLNTIFSKSTGEIEIHRLEHSALIALQGPQSMQVLAKMNSHIKEMPFMTARGLKLADIDCWISRSGYTGEMGFEIATDTSQIINLCHILLADDEVKMAGLGARDSLRLEAGLPLYGNDMDEQTTPVEANLNFVLNKKRVENADFMGAEKIIHQLSNGTEYLRVGIEIEGRTPVRKGAAIMYGDEEVGVVTSGCFSPTLQKPIAFARIKTSMMDKKGLLAVVRKSQIPVKLGKLVFVPAHNR